MTKEEFDLIFKEATDEVQQNLKDTIAADIKKLSDENGKISATNLASFALVESVKLNQKLLYSVLFKALVKD